LRELVEVTYDDNDGDSAKEVGRTSIEGPCDIAAVVNGAENAQIYHADFVHKHDRLVRQQFSVMSDVTRGILNI
jgi:hypothetical protein